jgi:hypothetical protein
MGLMTLFGHEPFYVVCWAAPSEVSRDDKDGLQCLGLREDVVSFLNFGFIPRPIQDTEQTNEQRHTKGNQGNL